MQGDTYTLTNWADYDMTDEDKDVLSYFTDVNGKYHSTNLAHTEIQLAHCVTIYQVLNEVAFQSCTPIGKMSRISTISKCFKYFRIVLK